MKLKKKIQLKNVITGVLVAGFLLALGFNLPGMHYSLIRSYVGSKTVMVTNKAGTSGGSGIHITAPSGQTYILTNDHVCEVSEDKINVYIQTDDSSRSVPRRIIEKSDYTDLCLVEALPDYTGLKVGREPSIGQIVAAIGHPRLLPNTMSRGEIIGQKEVMVFDRILSEGDECNLPKNKIQKVKVWFFEANACFININANISNVTTLPGSSGSPVVNFWGNVVGLVFAGMSDANWGLFVTVKDINKFLQPY